MTDKSNTAIGHKLDNGNIITPKGKLFFAKFLYTPQENQQGQMKYNLDLCFKPGTDLSLLKNEMGKLALDKLDGDATRAKNFVNKRFIDPNNKPSGGKPAGPEYEGWVSIRASSDTVPDFITANGKKMSIEDAKKVDGVYSGRWARVTVKPYWSGNSKNPGVFLGLVNVQLLEHDTPIGFVKPQGESEFGAVEVADTAAPISGGDDTAPTGGSAVDALFD